MKMIRLSRVVCLVGALAGSDAFAQGVGWIEAIEGEVGALKLVRQGQNEPVKPYAQLHPGDQILVAGQKAAVLIGSPEGKTQRITAAQSPFTIASNGNAPTVSGNVLKWVNGLFGGETRKNAPQALSAMSTRGGDSSPLSVPYLSKRFMVVAGKRPLYLSWAGGEPPYRVRLVREADGREVLAVSDIKGRSIVTPGIDLAEGDYSLEIVDKAQTAYEDSIRAVPTVRLPAFPDAQGLSLLPESSARLVKASWLGSAESGRWVIEAMQQLHELSGSTPAAKAVLQRMEDGASVD